MKDFIDTQLETTQLLLVPPKLEDIPALSMLWQTEAVQCYLGGVISPEESAIRMNEILDTWKVEKKGLWVVFEREKNEPIGLCGFGKFEGQIELAYKFFPQYWGKGYGFEAAFAALEYGFEILSLDEIVAITQTANLISCALLEKLGMRCNRHFMKWDAQQSYYQLRKRTWKIQSKLKLNLYAHFI